MEHAERGGGRYLFETTSWKGPIRDTLLRPSRSTDANLLWLAAPTRWRLRPVRETGKQRTPEENEPRRTDKRPRNFRDVRSPRTSSIDFTRLSKGPADYYPPRRDFHRELLAPTTKFDFSFGKQPREIPQHASFHQLLIASSVCERWICFETSVGSEGAADGNKRDENEITGANRRWLVGTGHEEIAHVNYTMKLRVT